MTTRELISNDPAFSPEETQVLAAVFEASLQEPGLANQEDPAAVMVAERIMELARQGERDPKQLFECTIKSIRQTWL
jgi:hypothetical protein